MTRRIARHLARNAIAYLTLFIALSGSADAAARIGSAQVADNTLRSADIRDRGIKGVDIARRTLQANHVRQGVLRAGPRGPAGAKGDPGPAGGARAEPQRRPSGSEREGHRLQRPGRRGDAAADDLPAGAHPGPGAGAIEQEGSPANEFALWLRLRDAADTTTLAETMPAWDSIGAEVDAFVPLAPGGVLLAGVQSEAASPSPTFVAPAGSYVLQLVAQAGGACGATLPSFGLNQGSQMGYVLTGTG